MIHIIQIKISQFQLNFLVGSFSQVQVDTTKKKKKEINLNILKYYTI